MPPGPVPPGGAPPAYGNADFGTGATSTKPEGKGRGPLLALIGLLVAGVIGIGAYLGLSGDDDGDASPDTTIESTQSTVADEATTTTESPEPVSTGPLSNDEAAARVVQIFAAVDGQLVCQGSGTIISNDGLILTNAHVVTRDDFCPFNELLVAITTSTDQPPEIRYRAEIYAFDPALDLAVIGIATDLDGSPVTVADLPAMPVGDSDQVGLGDSIEILGYPVTGGDTITFTSGSVSGFTAEAGIADRAFIKTDSVISGGNSGGLAMNADFELIGVPTQASGGAGLEVADCRVVTDTNGDGFIDANDTCIPIGGFLNGIRPINLALPLIEEAQARSAMDFEMVEDQPAPVGAEVLGLFFDVRMTSAIGDDNYPVDNVKFLPSGSTEVCAGFGYEEMSPYDTWDAVWTVDGQLVEEYSIFDSEWIGETAGDDWWVCAFSDVAGLPDGVYELALLIGGEFRASETVHIGDQFAPSPVTVVNAVGVDVCYLRLSPSAAGYWGPDELGATELFENGGSRTYDLPPGSWDVLAQDCDGNTLAEIYEIPVQPGTVIEVTPL